MDKSSGSMTDQQQVVVVGIDGSDHSLVALRRGISEAALRSADLHVLYVTDVTPAVLHLPDGSKVNTSDLAAVERDRAWQRATPLLDSAPATTKRVELDGYPADTIVDYCEQIGAELLILGTRGRGRLATTFLGSTSLRALERAHCDVLIAKL